MGKVRKMVMQHPSDRYVKKFSTYYHVVVMLFLAFEGYHSIREVTIGLLANAHNLSHLGLSYLVRRSAFLEDPEESWRKIIKGDELEYQNSLFLEMQRAYF